MPALRLCTRLCALVLALSVTSACGGASDAPPVAPAPAPASAPASPERAGAWSKFHSKRFQLSLGFPSGKTWNVDDHTAAALVAHSSALHARMRVAAFYEPQNQNRAMCTERAVGHDFVDELTEPFVERTEVHPSDYDGEWTVAVRKDARDPNALRGTITWIGAKYKRCVAVEYVITKSARDERELGEHLGEVRAGLEKTLTFDADRVH